MTISGPLGVCSGHTWQLILVTVFKSGYCDPPSTGKGQGLKLAPLPPASSDVNPSQVARARLFSIHFLSLCFIEGDTGPRRLISLSKVTLSID